MTQVDKDHYFGDYDNIIRWISYFYQIKGVRDTEGEILEIGVGNKTFYDYMSRRREIDSLDFDKDLNPDIVGDIRDIPVNTNEYDVVVAFEVLEHIDKEDLETALKELRRVAVDEVLISVPQNKRYVSAVMKLPIFHLVKTVLSVPKRKPKHKFDGEHHWELHTDKMSVSEFEKTVKKYFRIKDSRVPPVASQHRFYKLGVKNE